MKNSKRIKLSGDGERINIIIFSPKNVLSVFMLSVLILYETLRGLLILKALITNNVSEFIVFSPLYILWIVYAFLIFNIFFWTISGKEIISIDQNKFIIRNDLFGFKNYLFGKGAEKVLSVDQIKNIRLIKAHWGNWFKTISVDLEEKRHLLGYKLNEGEANKIVQVLKEKLKICP